jgi:hypothetical protein
MSQRLHSRACRFALVALLATQFVAAQGWKPPRTRDEKVDLQGTWTNGFATPLERSKEFANKPFFTPEEAAAYEKMVSERPQSGGDSVADPEVWWEKGMKVVSTLRTSMIYDPSDGRIPALTPRAQKKMSDVRAETRRHPDSGPEDRSLMERCIVSPVGGPVPMLPGPYNNNYQIVQTPDYMIIAVEMIHDVRVIPIGKGTLPPVSGVRQWLGESHGHWEGDTLVVDTTNFTDRTRFRGSDENLRLTERFSRPKPGILLYQFTVDDPTAFAAPWSAEIPMATSEGPMYEFACHEGNSAMMNMLNTARLAEKAAGVKTGK